MSASEHLSPEQFPPLFHGSHHDLRGDTLRPGVHSGAGAGSNATWGQSNSEVISASSDEDKAWNMASYARGMSGHGDERLRVYEVEPNAETRMGVEHKEHPARIKAFEDQAWRKPEDNAEFVAPSFKVKRQIDTNLGNQGTFPSINWNKHAKNNRSAPDANHPYTTHYDDRLKEANKIAEPARRAKRMAAFDIKRNGPKPQRPKQPGMLF